MTIRVYISQDTTAVSVGAERVATAFVQAALDAELSYTLVRNGSRGAFGLEPLVEIEMGEQGRVAFGPISVADVPSLVTAITDGEYERHSNYLGPVNTIPWLDSQTRITFKRCGEGDPTDLANYCALGGYRGLDRALTLSPQAIVDEIKVFAFLCIFFRDFNAWFDISFWFSVSDMSSSYSNKPNVFINNSRIFLNRFVKDPVRFVLEICTPVALLAFIKESKDSACIKSILLFKSAALVNSPASAYLTPKPNSSFETVSMITGLPCVCISIMSSPVKDFGFL